MARLKSATRTISNRGPRPRFIGQFPCSKPAQEPPFGRVAWLPFDSVSSLCGALWLEWREDIAKIDFEAGVDVYEETAELPALRAITDFHVVMDTGEVGRVEQKYSVASLSSEEKTRLATLAEHAKRRGLTFELMDRVTLEERGFIQTILLLRPYGLLPLPQAVVSRAKERLGAYSADVLRVWRQRARQHRVPLAATYKLLYQQQLPLQYEPLTVAELEPCLV